MVCFYKQTKTCPSEPIQNAHGKSWLKWIYLGPSLDLTVKLILPK